MVDDDSEATLDSGTILEILSICYRHRFDESQDDFQEDLDTVISRWVADRG